MKNLLFILCFVNILFASKKDTLIDSSTFKRYYLLIEDCDVCGSSSGGSLGYSSMINPSFVGIRYFNQKYRSTDGLYSNSKWFDENYNTMQIWARIPLNKKIQVSAIAPYHFHNRETNNGSQTLSGIGDITILGFYSIIKTKKDSLSFKHNVMIGGGLKMPTGTYDQKNNGSFNPSYQLGTGSWDYMIASEYVLKKNRLGLNTMINYTFKTVNNKEYRFGNQLNYGSTVFYAIDVNKTVLVPQIGFSGEVYDENIQYNQKLTETAGDAFFGKFGLEIGRNKFSLGINTMLPFNQNLNNGNLEAKYRWSFNVNYSL